MKYILPSTFIIGILIGTSVNITHPEYLSVEFEDNHYIVEEKEPIVETAYAQEIEKKPQYQLSDRALDHVAMRYETSVKIKEKFGEYGQEAIELYSRESGLNHKAVNPSSGACGLVQALPCSKMGCELEDLDCQLEWGYKYIKNRYGNAKKALEFHDQNNWY